MPIASLPLMGGDASKRISRAIKRELSFLYFSLFPFQTSSSSSSSSSAFISANSNSVHETTQRKIRKHRNSIPCFPRRCRRFPESLQLPPRCSSGAPPSGNARRGRYRFTSMSTISLRSTATLTGSVSASTIPAFKGFAVHGVEYAYGAHDHPTTGIFDAEPRSCSGFAFRKSILVGRTDLGPEEVQDLMVELAESYSGNSYNLISKNCNHFCNDACLRLTGYAIPSWVNRLANLGFFCKCVLPVHVAAVRSRAEEGNGCDGERRRLRSGSTRYGGGGSEGQKRMTMVSSLRSGSRGKRRGSLAGGNGD